MRQLYYQFDSYTLFVGTYRNRIKSKLKQNILKSVIIL